MTYEQQVSERRDKYAYLAETSRSPERVARMEGYAAGLSIALRYYKGELMGMTPKQLSEFINKVNKLNDYDLVMRWAGTPPGDPYVEVYEEADFHVLATGVTPSEVHRRMLKNMPDWDLEVPS